MRSRPVIATGLLVAALVALTYGPLAAAPADHPGHPAPAARLEAAVAAPPCALTDQDGRPFGLADLRGRAVLLTFVYTTCPDVCPLLVGSLATIQHHVNQGGRRDLVAVFVTTDPELDSPAALKAYATRRSIDLAAAFFLTGAPAELRAVWDAFGVTVRRVARGLVDHTPLTVLIDGDGVIRQRYLGGVLDTKTVVADARRAVRRAGPTERGVHGTR